MAELGPTVWAKPPGPDTETLAAEAGGSPVTPMASEPTEGPEVSLPPQAASEGQERNERGDGGSRGGHGATHMPTLAGYWK